MGMPIKPSTKRKKEMAERNPRDVDRGLPVSHQPTPSVMPDHVYQPADATVMAQAKHDEAEKGDEKPTNKQSYTAHVGDEVSLNGNLFHMVAVNPAWDWILVGPNGRTVPMKNPDTPGPSFIAEEEGDYKAMLSTRQGDAVVMVHVTKKKEKD
jgi:hypothetical protein